MGKEGAIVGIYQRQMLAEGALLVKEWTLTESFLWSLTP